MVVDAFENYDFMFRKVYKCVKKLKNIHIFPNLTQFLIDIYNADTQINQVMQLTKIKQAQKFLIQFN